MPPSGKLFLVRYGCFAYFTLANKCPNPVVVFISLLGTPLSPPLTNTGALCPLPNMFKLVKLGSLAVQPHPRPDMFKVVHFVTRTVGKGTAGIQLC